MNTISRIRSVCVFCGAARGNNPAYAEALAELGRGLAERDMTLINGGGAVGLMGVTADAVLAVSHDTAGDLAAWLPAVAPRIHVVPNGVAPFLALPGSWDDYLAALPAKLRHEIRRKERRLAAEAGPLEVVVATPETVEDLLDSFIALHRTSEGPKGVFMQPGMEIFFRRLGEVFVASGIFQLAFVVAGGRRMAGTIAFRFGDTTYLYNSAFDRSLEHWSPGMVLVGEDIRLAIEAGCTGFDMLKGDYAYKYRFGATARAVRRIAIERT